MVVWPPSEDLGLSAETIEQEDISLIQFSGLYPVNRYYATFLCTLYGIGSISIPGMVAGAYLEGETTIALESAHLALIVINMAVQTAAHLYNSDITKRLYRAINEDFFSYGDTMNDDYKNYIDELDKKKNQRKKVAAKMFRVVCFACSFGVCIKKPLLYFINGHGVKEVDGLNWIIYECPTGLYVPYSNYWVPYILGVLFSFTLAAVVTSTSPASVSTFSSISEEFLHQLFILKLGLRKVNARAQHLCDLKFGTIKSKDKALYEMCLKECLKRSVMHHHTITDLFKGYKKLMYYPLFTVIFDGSALICMSTAIMMTNDSFAVRMSIPSFLVGELYYTYQYCGYGARMARAFAEVGDQLYLAEFLEHTKLMKPYMLAINTYSLVPQQLSAAGFTSPNLQSFGNVMRTAYSLLNFLITRK